MSEEKAEDLLSSLLNNDSYSLLFSIIVVNLSLSLLSYTFSRVLSLFSGTLLPKLNPTQTRMLSRRFAVVSMHTVAALLGLLALFTLKTISIPSPDIHPNQMPITETLHTIWIDMNVKFIEVTHEVPRQIGLQGLMLCRNALLFDAALNLVDIFSMSSVGGRVGYSSSSVNGATAIHHFACLILVCAVFTLGLIDPETAKMINDGNQSEWNQDRFAVLFGYGYQISRVLITLSVCGIFDLCLAPSTMACLLPKLGTKGNNLYAYVCLLYALISVIVLRFGYANICAYFVISSVTAEFDDNSVLISGVFMVSLFFLWIYWSQLARAMWSLFTSLIIVHRKASQLNEPTQFFGQRSSNVSQNKKND